MAGRALAFVGALAAGGLLRREHAVPDGGIRGLRFGRCRRLAVDDDRVERGLVGRQFGVARREVVPLQQIAHDVGVGSRAEAGGRALGHGGPDGDEHVADGQVAPAEVEGRTDEGRGDAVAEQVGEMAGRALALVGAFAAGGLLLGIGAVPDGGRVLRVRRSRQQRDRDGGGSSSREPAGGGFRFRHTGRHSCRHGFLLRTIYHLPGLLGPVRFRLCAVLR